MSQRVGGAIFWGGPDERVAVEGIRGSGEEELAGAAGRGGARGTACDRRTHLELHLAGPASEGRAAVGAQQQAANTLQSKLNASDARAHAASEALAQRLGTTQAQLDARTQSILAKQQADAARLANSQEAAEQRINTEVSAVKTDVGSVKTDLGSTKTDVGSVKADLADTKSQLQRTVGDAGVMSGLIARNS